MAPPEATRTGPIPGPAFLRRVGYPVAAVLFFAHAAVLVLTQGQPYRENPLSFMEMVESAVVAAAFVLAALSAKRGGGRPAAAWSLLAAAFVAYAAGDALAAVFRVTLTQSPLSVAMNGCYLLFYPLFLAGLLELPKSPLSRTDRLRLLLDLGIVMGSACIAVWVLLLQPLIAQSSPEPLKLALTLAYPVGDMVLLWGLLSLYFRGRDPEARWIYRLLGLSAGILIVTDLFYSYQILSRNELLYPWASMGYVLSHLAALLAALHAVARPPSAEPKPAEEPLQTRPAFASMLLAFAALSLAWLVLLLSGRVEASALSMVMIPLVVLFVLLRQILETRVNRNLLEGLRAAREELEARVEERTHDLRMAVDELQSEIAERQRAQEERRATEERFSALVQNSYDIITIHDTEGKVLYESPSLSRILGHPPGSLQGRTPFHLVHPDDMAIVRGALARVAEGTNTGTPTEYRLRRGDGSWTYVESVGSNLLDNPAVGGIVLTSREVTDRRLADERIRLQLQRLEGLRAIDSAITGGLDLRATLAVFLDQVVRQLSVDAAAVLLLDPDAKTLEYALGQGFKTQALQHTRIRLGESFAGRAALERRLLRVEDLAVDPGGFTRSPLLMSEGFHAYFAAPLVARGQVKGVFEVFHRGALAPDDEWLNYLQTLAGQAAIALDNMSLLQTLQLNNVELALAYETTLEGWSKALEMRDRETQGHAARVAEMTVRLAREAGIPDKELVHVRRGALLHDIGKMGIPDSILLKPGPLTDEEWAVMRQHPVYAYDLLSPVEFLRPALDIPYCHHERWDGAGYPRGLKGEQIPLSARVFAVVDTWDALSFERPYRSAWPPDRVRKFLEEHAGLNYDPRVVRLFLERVL